ncbi:transcriptional regulator, GntR family [Paraburkholderia susongensis]|uniref:Transcriptional regulator, GntR family n=2 Tax=Paraburkholderia susongensis TaxID=1515439 RepID=A0A1X7ISA2_9BURK|nr:transcriptional regulator, GntR family [Paraburkholderia susongensis]
MYRSISGALLDGKLRPGTPLRERNLAEVFGATRTAVRKVLARLEREGKVELRQNRGAFVPQPSVEDIHAVYDARRAVEGGMLMLLASRLGATQLRALSAHVKREEEAHRAGDREESIRLAGAFHTHLTRMLGNAELEAFLQRLLARTQLFVALYESHDQSSCAPGEHRAIVEALARGEASAAVSTMLHHLDEIEARITRHVTRDDQEDLADIFNRY